MRQPRLNRAASARSRVLEAVREAFDALHPPERFRPGRTPVPASGKVFDAEELACLVDSALDFWLTTGRFAEAFERKLARRLRLKHALLVNSGSSANLLAVTALTAPELGARALRPGDEVIAAAASFPTTVNPILQNGAVPVLVDVDIPTCNAPPERIAEAVSTRTRAIVLAHTLGNPFAADQVARLARERGIWLVEDCCDALGSTFRGVPVAAFGDLATFSFYPAHHITMGEGGAVATDNGQLRRLLESLRDWGRDCWCAPGKDNTCGNRFGWRRGGLPFGYDHKYIYSHLGYNLKATDMQAAVGLSQLDKLGGFVKARKRNFKLLKDGLKRFADRLILPQATPGSDPAWFGFPVTLRDEAGFKREELTRFLEERKIGTRLLFAGNITRQPYFQGRPHRVAGSLDNTDKIMRDTFWIGLYPGISEEMIAYVLETFEEFFSSRGRG